MMSCFLNFLALQQEHTQTVVCYRKFRINLYCLAKFCLRTSEFITRA